MLYGSGNIVGDLDKEIYANIPTWEECIKILAPSLVQLHISDAKGTDYNGEGLRLKHGRIPITKILNIVSDLGKTIQGTIEIKEGHLYNAKFQLEAAEWLLEM